MFVCNEKQMLRIDLYFFAQFPKLSPTLQIPRKLTKFQREFPLRAFGSWAVRKWERHSIALFCTHQVCPLKLNFPRMHSRPRFSSDWLPAGSSSRSRDSADNPGMYQPCDLWPQTRPAHSRDACASSVSIPLSIVSVTSITTSRPRRVNRSTSTTIWHSIHRHAVVPCDALISALPWHWDLQGLRNTNERLFTLHASRTKPYPTWPAASPSS